MVNLSNRLAEMQTQFLVLAEQEIISAYNIREKQFEQCTLF